MKISKLINLLIADPKLEIDEDDIKAITFDEGLLSIKARGKNPLDNTSLTMDIVYTEEEIDAIIKKDDNGEFDKAFGFELNPGTQAEITRLEHEKVEENKG